VWIEVIYSGKDSLSKRHKKKEGRQTKNIWQFFTDLKNLSTNYPVIRGFRIHGIWGYRPAKFFNLLILSNNDSVRMQQKDGG